MSGTSQTRANEAFRKAARKDPAVFPLALIIGGTFAAAGYFWGFKWTAASEPERQYMPVSHPWQDSKGVQTSPAETFKYKYRNRKTGEIENAPVASQREVYPVDRFPEKLHKQYPHDGSDN